MTIEPKKDQSHLLTHKDVGASVHYSDSNNLKHFKKLVNHPDHGETIKQHLKYNKKTDNIETSDHGKKLIAKILQNNAH